MSKDKEAEKRYFLKFDDFKVNALLKSPRGDFVLITSIIDSTVTFVNPLIGVKNTMSMMTMIWEGFEKIA